MRRRRYKWVPLLPKRSGVEQSAPVALGLMMVRPEEVSVVRSEISCQAELIPEDDPAVGPHDQVVSLLHGAAEIEHSLLVQYLYAAYSLEMDPKHFTGEVPAEAESLVRMWRDSMATIAVQEMAHLLTVQNLLRFIGGPLNFEREDLPFKSDLYPFHFALRPLSRKTLGWYIAAEMPNDPPSEIFPDEIAKEIAATLPEGRCVNRVGALYERLIALFDKLPDRVFRPQSVAFQARPRDWGADSELLVYEIGSKKQALDALVDIGRQGEGFGGPADPETHFRRLLEIYRHPEFPRGSEKPNWSPFRPVVTNPRTKADGGGAPDDDTTPTVITNTEALWWARLFNLRYRMLLHAIDHSLRIGDAPVQDEEEPLLRRHLISWSRRQMTSGLREIAMKLTELPIDGSGQNFAGPPFELPDSLAATDRDPDLWMRHREMIACSQALIDQGAPSSAGSAQILNRLRDLDARIETFIGRHHLDAWPEPAEAGSARNDT